MKRTLKTRLNGLREKQFLLMGGLLGLWFCLYSFAIRPALERSSLDRRRIVFSLNQLKANREHLVKLAMQPDAAAETNSVLASVRPLTSRPDVAALMEQINALNQQSSLRNFAWRLSPESKTNGTIRVLPVSFQFDGDFFNVCQFILRCESLPWLTHVSQLDFKGKKAMNGQVETQMVLNVYFEGT